MVRLLAAILAALLAGCASPKPPITRIAEPVTAADPCDTYKYPTTFARCRLFTSADAWRFIPPTGRNADLDTQLRCAPLRPNPRAYERCIAAPTIIALPGVEPAAPRVEPQIAAPAARIARSVQGRPSAVEPSAAPRFEPPAPPPPSAAVQEPRASIGRSEPPPADDAIRQAIIQQSIARYSGSCPCPYNVDRAGRRCGGRSAYSRPGGASPLCYPADVPASAVAAYRNTLAAR